MVSLVSILAIFIISTVSIECALVATNCGSQNEVIQLTQFSLVPHPIKVPGLATFNLQVDLKQDLVNPIRTEILLYKRILGFYIKAPCENDVGSCNYASWCDLCKTCSCTLLAGVQQMSMTMNMTSAVPTGDYRAEIRFISATNQRGCVKIDGIVVQK